MRGGGARHAAARLGPVSRERAAGGARGAELEADGIPTVSLELRSLRRLPRALRELRGIVRAWRPAVVQTSLWHANILARVGLRAMRVPVVDTMEAVDPEKPRRRVWLDRLTHRLAARHVASCRAVADVVAARERLRPDRLRVIRFGLHPAEWAVTSCRGEARRAFDLPDTARVVAWTGRLEPEKNLPALLAAVSSMSGWWLLVAGQGRLGPELPSLAEQAGLSGRYRFVGELADVRPVLAAADVFALASSSEGLPLALLEAMAAGLPVVAPAVGGIPEAVTHGHDGLLLAKSDPVGLACAIEEASGRPELGPRARETVRRRFAPETMLAAYDALWREVADG